MKLGSAILSYCLFHCLDAVKKLLISESQVEIYLRGHPLGTTDATQTRKDLENTVTNLTKLATQDKLGKV